MRIYLDLVFRPPNAAGEPHFRYFYRQITEVPPFLPKLGDVVHVRVDSVPGRRWPLRIRSRDWAPDLAEVRLVLAPDTAMEWQPNDLYQLAADLDDLPGWIDGYA